MRAAIVLCLLIGCSEQDGAREECIALDYELLSNVREAEDTSLLEVVTLRVSEAREQGDWVTCAR